MKINAKIMNLKKKKYLRIVRYVYVYICVCYIKVKTCFLNLYSVQAEIILDLPQEIMLIPHK